MMCKKAYPWRNRGRTPGKPYQKRNHMQDTDRTPRDEDSGKTYVVGNNPVKELLRATPEKVDFVYFRKGRRDKAMEEIIALCKKKRVPFKSASNDDLDRMYKGNHQGVAARTAALSYMEVKELLELGKTSPVALIIALDQVQDPANVGVLARTVYALGGAGIIVCRHHGSYLGAGAVKASSGALNLLPVAKAGNMSSTLEQCVKAGYHVYCTGAEDEAESLYETELRTPAVLVLGNEEKGVRPGVSKGCEEMIRIPFAREFDSLNVAQAGAVILAEFARRQG